MKKRGWKFLCLLCILPALLIQGCGSGDEKRQEPEGGAGQETMDESSGGAGETREEEQSPDQNSENSDSGEGEKTAAGYPRELLRGELLAFTNWINQGDNYGNYGFLLSEYTDPADADLNQILYTGAGMESQPLTSEEQQAYLKATGLPEISTDITRLTTSQINEFLERKLGLSMKDMRGDFDWVYLENTDAWVHEHGDTNYTPFTCVSGQETEKGVYELSCVPGDGQTDLSLYPPCRLTLAKHDDDYRILSNVYDSGIQYSRDIWEIEDQSFDVDLGGSWGQVKFVSYGPNTSVYSTQDVSFALEKGGNTIYEFPDVMDGNFRSHETFLNILAVSFQDYSGDGEKDVIIICEYAPLINTASGGTLKEVRLYRNMGDSFQLDRDKMDWLQVNDYCNTVDQVLEHVNEAAANE